MALGDANIIMRVLCPSNACATNADICPINRLDGALDHANIIMRALYPSNACATNADISPINRLDRHRLAKASSILWQNEASYLQSEVFFVCRPRQQT